MFNIVKNLPHYISKISFYQYFLEKMVLLQEYKSGKPQLFILGLPRSGTTLVYQYIVHRLNVAYFTNGVGKYPHYPCVITLFQNRLYGGYRSDFKSNYGKVTGPESPREAGPFWGRFFGFENYVSFESVSSEDVRLLRNTIGCIQRIYGNAPFVNKNVKHMLRIDALGKIFPNSIFLIVERDLKDVAISVIRGRYKNLKDPREWWSVKPPDYLKLKDLPIAEQVSNQLISLQEKMESDLSSISSKRVLRIKYEGFCSNPELLVDELIKNIGYVAYRNKAVSLFEQSFNDPQTIEEIQLMELVENAISR